MTSRSRQAAYSIKHSLCFNFLSLYLDVAATLREAGLNDVVLTGGRYGLGSKDTPPSSIFALFKELEKDQPKERFTLGITDDVTFLSLPEVMSSITVLRAVPRSSTGSDSSAAPTMRPCSCATTGIVSTPWSARPCSRADQSACAERICRLKCRSSLAQLWCPP